jgi:PIN domain nuclease of toxin-antitoxin system
VWIWSLLEPRRLARKARAALAASDSSCWLSPISVWECALLIERGRLEVGGSPEEWIRAALSRAPLQEAPINHDVALFSRRIALLHGNPDDRFLAATAAVYDLTLITADARLLGGKGYASLKAA